MRVWRSNRLASAARRTAILASALLAALAAGLAGAEFKADEAAITLSGQLDNATVDKVEDALRDAAPPVRKVNFRHCLGGQLGPANRLIRLIKTNFLHTTAAQQVSSACAYAFLAGHTRTLDPQAPVVLIGLHNARRGDGSPTSSPQIASNLLRQLTAMQLPAELAAIADTSYAQDSGLVITVHQAPGGTNRREFFACPAGSGGNFERCRKLPDYDLHAIGILR